MATAACGKRLTGALLTVLTRPCKPMPVKHLKTPLVVLKNRTCRFKKPQVPE
jgi:hypothetical protein